MTDVVTAGHVAGVIPFSNVDGPGNRFVLFLQGCDFDCIACHNPQTIPVLTPHANWMTVADVLDCLRDVVPFVSGVTVSGGEATRQAPFVRALFEALRADERFAGLTRFVDSHGGVPEYVWDELEPVMDAAMVDLKCFDDTVHRRMTGHANDRVLRSIARLAAVGKLYEVRLLMVPGLNDAPGLLDRTAAWLHGVDPEMRVKVIGFRRHGVRPCARELREPCADDMAAYGVRVRAAGLERVVVV